MIRWMRTFILALLLPAYCFAAVHVEHFDLPRGCERDAQVSGYCESIGDDHGGNSMSMSELSDTSDDVCDHCIPYTFKLTAVRVRVWTLPLELPQVPDAVLPRLLRPPSQLRP